jgi:cAMP-dependent protein kinase regulator
LTKAERATIADSLTTEQHWDGEVIVKQDDPGDKFYIIVEGKVEISRFGEVCNLF